MLPRCIDARPRRVNRPDSGQQFGDYAPLLRQGYLDEAMSLLRQCRDIAQRVGDITLLARSVAALADIEDTRGHGMAATRLGRDALRYAYLTNEPQVITACHHHMGNYLRRYEGRTDAGLAHHLAAAVIGIITDTDGVEASVRGAADDFHRLGDSQALPSNLASLSSGVADVEGVDLERIVLLVVPRRKCRKASPG